MAAAQKLGLVALGGIRPDATMKRVRATLLLVLATSALAACRQLRQDNATGSGVVLSDGTALFEGADRESWCRANLPAYNRSEPLPAGFAPVPSYGVAERSVAGAPAPAYGSTGAARAPRSAPQPLMVPGPHRRARYVCSDAFFFCFARDRMSADDARVCAHHCCHGVCPEDFQYSAAHGWCSTRTNVHACCDLCTQQAASGKP